MRRNLLVAILVGTGLSFSMWCTAAAQTQGQPARSSGGSSAGVAIVDIPFIFKNYTKFSTLHDQLKKDMKTREEEFIKLQNEVKGMLNQRGQLNPESQSSRDLDIKIAQKKTELELLNDSSRREFTQREATIYHQTYQEVEAQVKRYAQANGIILVLRKVKDDAEPLSANPQQEVMREMTQQVIYALPTLDITDVILEMLNGRPNTNTTPANTKPTQTQGKTSPGGSVPKTGNQTDKNDSKKPTGGTIKK